MIDINSVLFIWHSETFYISTLWIIWSWVFLPLLIVLVGTLDWSLHWRLNRFLRVYLGIWFPFSFKYNWSSQTDHLETLFENCNNIINMHRSKRYNIWEYFFLQQRFKICQCLPTFQPLTSITIRHPHKSVLHRITIRHNLNLNTTSTMHLKPLHTA